MDAKHISPWFGLLLIGCLDLELLDDMVAMDAGGAAAADGQGSADGNSDAKEADKGASDTGGMPSPDATDTTPPRFLPIPCGPFERLDQSACIAEGPAAASLRFETDEPAVLSLIQPEGLALQVFNEPWSTAHYVAVSGLSSGGAALALRVEDINGNGVSSNHAVSEAAGVTVVLTEVLADPLGPEPAQEFVEIVNFGEADVDLSGWMIDDNGDANGDTLPPGTALGPGEVAMLVSPEYDVLGVEDPSPAATVRTITLDSSIGSNGLKNAEAESLELYDASGQVVSRYDGALGPPREGISVVRRAPELPEGAPWLYVLDPNGTSTPGGVDLIVSVPVE
jgi:hypothetical protein